MLKFWFGKVLLLYGFTASLALAVSGCGEEAAEGPTLSQGQLRFGERFPGELVEGFADPITDPQVSDEDFARLIQSNTAFAPSCS